MKNHLLHLPWNHPQDVPHAVIDITRECNMNCGACYNQSRSGYLSIANVEQNIQGLLERRRLQSVMLAGGEPTLHPNLFEIIKLLKDKGLYVEIISNGLLLNPELAADLKKAGADMIFIHIDSRQNRPDLPSPPSLEQLATLWAEKGRIASEAGLNTGLAITAFKENLIEVVEAVNAVVKFPYFNYLLITLERDLSGVEEIKGDIFNGMIARWGESAEGMRQQGPGMGEIITLLKDSLGFKPFAYLGSNDNQNDIRWLSYLIGSVIRSDNSCISEYLSASIIERLFLFLSRIIAGRYPFYLSQDPGRFRLQILLNTFFSGRISQNLKLFIHSLNSKSSLQAKRLLIQYPATVEKDGHVTHCKNCPDAVLKNGNLVPVCISDYV